jgi:hypothetical protein
VPGAGEGTSLSADNRNGLSLAKITISFQIKYMNRIPGLAFAVQN